MREADEQEAARLQQAALMRRELAEARRWLHDELPRALGELQRTCPSCELALARRAVRMSPDLSARRQPSGSSRTALPVDRRC